MKLQKRNSANISGAIFHVENNKHSEWLHEKFVEAKGINAIWETISYHPWGSRLLKRMCPRGPSDLHAFSKRYFMYL